MAIFDIEPSGTGAAQRAQFVYPFTDMGFAQQFHRQHGTRLRYDVDRGEYLVWGNTARWLRGGAAQEQLMRLVKQTQRELYRQAKSSRPLRTRNNEPVTQAQALKWAKKAESKGRINAMLELVRKFSGVPISSAELDLDPYLLGVANGVLDLRTGTLIENRPKLLITRHARAAYDPEAKAPTFLRFIDEACCGRQDLVDFVQEGLGYALSGLTKEQALFIFVGTGANGKSTLVEAFSYMMGDNASSLPSHSLFDSHTYSMRNDIAGIAGSRFVVCAEINASKVLDESLVKRLTGGDIVSARFSGKNYFNFHPIAKLFLSVNVMPHVTGADNGIFRRIIVIPFDADFQKSMDMDLLEKLKSEDDGFLAWAVQGFLRWNARGHLVKPQCVEEACAAYRADMDTVQAFLDACCTLDTKATTPIGVMYETYCQWAKSAGIDPKKMHAFGRDMHLKKFKKSASGCRIWRGVSLNAAAKLTGTTGIFGSADNSESPETGLSQ